MKHSYIGNLILDYDDQAKLAVLASCYLKGEKHNQADGAANEFLNWVDTNLAPHEDEKQPTLERREHE